MSTKIDLQNRNFLEETLRKLEYTGKKEEDVSWVGTIDGYYSVSWEEFKKIIFDTWYNSDFGAQEIATDLVIVLKDGSYFSRGEYDGSEWWEYNTMPIKNNVTKKFTRIMVNKVDEIGWRTLGELNELKKEKKEEKKE